MSTPFYDLASLVVVPSGYKTSKVYAQKPQTTDGQLAFTRSTTATRVNSAGLIEASAINVPRLDYLNSTCPKLLLEPSRTNSITYSEQLDNAAWTKDNGSVTANAIASPDGSTNADLFTENTSTGNHRVYGSSLSTSANQPLSFSVFAKYNGRQYVYLRTDVLVPKTAVFDIQNGTTGTVSSGASSKIENYGNGWYRLTLIVNALAGNPAVCEGLVGLLDSNSYNNNSYTGNGTAGAYLWGFQVELNGAYATSYIPTTTAAVTRGADAASKTGISSLIGQTAGVMFIEYNKTHAADAAGEMLGIISDNSDPSANRIQIVLESAGAYLFATSGGVSLAFSSTITIPNGKNKLAVSYGANGYKFYINGVQQFSNATATVPAMQNFRLGSYVTSVAFMSDGVSQALLFTTQLTNAQLAELTTI